MIVIENRKPVWEALSELYLDTALSIDDLDRIAHILHKSCYCLNEIKQIDLYEVFPLLQSNLLSAAGVWTGFDQKWLISNCVRMHRKNSNLFFRARCYCKNIAFYWMRKDYWRRIEQRMTELALNT